MGQTQSENLIQSNKKYPSTISKASNLCSCLGCDFNEQNSDYFYQKEHELDIERDMAKPKGKINKLSVKNLSQNELQLFNAASGRNVSAIRYYIGQGVNINVLDEDRTSLLHVAARYGSVQVVEEIINQGGQVNITDMDGWTPLHIAVFFKRHFICHLLLKKGGNMYIRNREGNSPYDLIKDPNTQQAFDNHIKHLQLQKSQISVLDKELQQEIIDQQIINGQYQQREKNNSNNFNFGRFDNETNIKNQLQNDINKYDVIDLHQGERPIQLTGNTILNQNKQVVQQHENKQNYNKKNKFNVENNILLNGQMKIANQINGNQLMQNRKKNSDQLKQVYQMGEENLDNNLGEEIEDESNGELFQDQIYNNNQYIDDNYNNTDNLIQNKIRKEGQNLMISTKRTEDFQLTNNSINFNQNFNKYNNLNKKRKISILNGSNLVSRNQSVSSLNINEKQMNKENFPEVMQIQNQFINNQPDQTQQNALQAIYSSLGYSQNLNFGSAQGSPINLNRNQKKLSFQNFSQYKKYPNHENNIGENVELISLQSDLNSDYKQNDKKYLNLKYPKNKVVQYQLKINKQEVNNRILKQIFKRDLNVNINGKLNEIALALFNYNHLVGLGFMKLFLFSNFDSKIVSQFLHGQDKSQFVKKSPLSIFQCITDIRLQEYRELVNDFMSQFRFSMPFSSAIRFLFSHLEAESDPEKLDIVLRSFAKIYYQRISPKQESDKLFQNVDSCHMLAYATVMFDQQIQATQKINLNRSISDFEYNIAGLNDGENFKKELVSHIVENVLKKPLINYKSADQFKQIRKKQDNNQGKKGYSICNNGKLVIK
ncbi:Sec7 domain [Pseudocohnilembus persalinus]|uniref:Sec7 domain n=1 Tax=Pseudocohnilembus persalinus TaxID=266149 RepID=A0A0V0R8N9_PSEPJ|nr:Sec7 domain [Pseudocohnilembus persalinus]|eukprot:KRX10847.1 Sec7 domain [Pseudocohnilembus persalinus]